MDNNQSSILFPKDVVSEILLRLPIKPLFKYKCVSKEWKFMISDPKFAHKYMKQATSSPKSSSLWLLWRIIPYDDSSYVTKKPNDLSDSSVSSIHSIDDDAPPSLYLLEGYNRVNIIASSNGLILYQRDTCNMMQKVKVQLCISNPLTKKNAKLPLPVRYNCNFRQKFLFATRVGEPGCENPAYVSYKVVFIQIHTKHNVKKVFITIFCSDTGRWSDEMKVNNSLPSVVFGSKPFLSKGILHWFDWNAKALITYDPYDSPNRFGRFQLPSLGPNCKILGSSGVNLILLGHEDLLKFGEIEDCGDYLGLRLRVWLLLDSNKGEWCLWQTCVISPEWDERELTTCKMVAPFPWNEGIFCGLWIEDKELKARDLESGQDVFVDHSEVIIIKGIMRYQSYSFDPITLCPWSSPFYGNATRKSRLVSGFRKISPVWFPLSTRYPSLLD